MAETTSIEWSDSTFNPWIGCMRVSTSETGGGGCDGCYAAESTPVRVLRGKGQETWGPGAPRKRTSADYWKQPLRWNERKFFQCTCCGWRGDEIDLKPPTFGVANGCIHDLVPARRRVFCASLADVFDNEVDPAWRADLFALIAATPNLDWLLLTKRIGNAARMITDALITISNDHRLPPIDLLPAWPWPHVWLGATIVNQHEADRDVRKLLATPAAIHFVSIEPMLGPVDLLEAVSCPECRGVGFGYFGPDEIPCSSCEGHESGPIDLAESGLDWVIAGGESGPAARPAHPGWFRSLRDQCAAAEVRFLFKQNGEWVSVSEVAGPGAHHSFPDGAAVRRVGKKLAGRTLDGREHNKFPEVRHG